MTFGSLPGMCVVAYTFQCGYEERPVSLSGFFATFRMAKEVKKEAIKETGRMLAGKYAGVFVVLVTFILLCIATDSWMLAVVNISASVVGVFAHRQGRKYRLASGLSVEEARRRIACAGRFHNEAGLWRPIIWLMFVWLSLIVPTLAIAHALGLWHPK